MTEVPTITLQELMLQQRPLGTAVVIDGQEAVILARGEDGELVEVYQGGEIRQCQPGTRATMLADPDRRVAVLLDAVLLMASLRRQQTAEYHDALNRIRDYAIEKYCEGGICLEGLNEFLRTFDLPEYESGD
jgi:hypothetical protein